MSHASAPEAKVFIVKCRDVVEHLQRSTVSTAFKPSVLVRRESHLSVIYTVEAYERPNSSYPFLKL